MTRPADQNSAAWNTGPVWAGVPRREVIGLIGLMALHFLLVVDQLRQMTPTVDEVAHLPAGISYLQHRTFKMYRFSPPLARLLPALAGMTAGPEMYYGPKTWGQHKPVNHWLFAFGFLTANLDEPDRYLSAFTRARLVIALWSTLTIPFLFWWGRWWFGPASGWLAAALWTLCPNLIAHSGLMTTDLPATSFGLIATLFFARWLEQPTWRRTLVAGLWLGFAQLVKFTSLWLYLIWTAWFGASRLLRPPPKPPAAQILAMFLVSVLVLNTGYLFEGTGKPIGDFVFVCDMLTRPLHPGEPPDRTSSSFYNQILEHRVNRFRGSWLGRVPCPFPEHYVGGFDEQKLEADGYSKAIPTMEGYQMYLFGRLSRTGWWYYYFVALALKVPLSTWCLVLLALVGALCWRSECRRKLVPLVGITLGPLLAMSLLTDINIGVRYVLPILPFFFLIAASHVGASRPRWWNGVALAALLWNGLAIARIHPHELSYFNELVGPKNGRFYLIDSNLDWGQDLRGLARWLERHPDWRDLRIGYMGTVPPEFEGIARYRLAPRDLRHVPADQRLADESPDDPTTYGPQPGKFAISVNFERGMQFHTPCPLALLPQLPQDLFRPAIPLLLIPQNAFRYFQHFTPTIVPEVGYSILLYDISVAEANRVREQLGMPPTAQ